MKKGLIMEKSMFDLITVRFADKYTDARPFEFFKDSEDNFIAPAKAITSCPFCGHGQEVDLSYVEDFENISVVCANCNAGNEVKEFNDPELSQNPSSDIVIETPKQYQDADDVEAEILAALAEEDLAIISEDGEESYKTSMKESITIDDSQEIQSLKSSCPFVDPIKLETFQLDEL